jgi:hypothetical protein
MKLDHWRITKDPRGLRYTIWILGEEPQSFSVSLKWLPLTGAKWKEEQVIDVDVAYQELYRYIARLGTKRQQRLMRIKAPQG